MNTYKMTREELETRIEEIQQEIETLTKEQDNIEIDNDEHEDAYCDMLDEISTVEIGSLTYNPSTVLREVDPTAYRCGLNDYVDSIDIEDTDDWKDLDYKIHDLESLLIDLESELLTLEEEESE